MTSVFAHSHGLCTLSPRFIIFTNISPMSNQQSFLFGLHEFPLRMSVRKVPFRGLAGPYKLTESFIPLISIFIVVS